MVRSPALTSAAVRILMRGCLIVASALALTVSASAGVLKPSACGSDPSPVLRLVSETIARVEVLARMTGGELCAAYQHHFLAAVHAREVVASCRDGTDRDRSVARLDGAIEAMNSGIAENCGLE
jgi:hypothetical protein